MSVRSSIQKFHIPSYNRNAVVQLIAFSGLGFVAVHLVWITLIVYAVPEQRSYELTFQYIGMGNWARISERWWTLFTYAWCHHGFWEWLSNMLWLYCFGNVVQNLVGYKQIIPLFVYSILSGGLGFALSQLLPAGALPSTTLMMGAHAGIIGLMSAALTLSPKYRIYLSDYFSVPLLLLAGIFFALMLLNSNFLLPNLMLIVISALAGFVYVKLLQNGYQPGAWAYSLYNKLDKSFSPKEPYRPLKNKSKHETETDRILDKINDKGYNSLSAVEKEHLREAGR